MIHTLRMELTLIQKIAIWALPLIFAITLHEVAHGYMALLFGDHTAKLSRRLSLNPIKHIDPLGTVIIPLFMLLISNFIFGWAKPVPVDPRNLHHPRRDMAFIALAGPLANFIMALFWGLIAKLGLWAELAGGQWFGVPLIYMGGAGIIINIVIGVLNLVPLPPLDGGRIAVSLLPTNLAVRFAQIEPYGFIILIVLLFTHILDKIMWPFILVILALISSIFF